MGLTHRFIVSAMSWANVDAERATVSLKTTGRPSMLTFASTIVFPAPDTPFCATD
jgi:hypothetical protein